jgi:RNA polymerase sigma-70 factor, ECF subfamily
MSRALQLNSDGLPNAKKECKTMEKPSTGLKETTASLRSDAQAAEKTLAVTQHYEEFRPRIYSHSYRLLGNRQDADDVTQEVFVSAYLTWDSLYAREKLAGWLYRIATNLCIDLLRQRKRLSSWVCEDAHGVSKESASLRSSHSGGIPEIAEREHIQRIFAHLPKGYALPLLLNAARGIPYQEIALIVGISPNAAATRLTRARKLFAEEYRRLDSDVIS